jgi:hypothetical protein
LSGQESPSIHSPSTEANDIPAPHSPALGSFNEPTVLVFLDEFLRYDLETRQAGGPKGRRNGDVGRVSPSGDDNAPNPRVIVPCIEGEPPTTKKHFVPGAEIHRCRIRRDTNVAKVPYAIPGWNVHASGERHRQMSKISANTATLLMSIRRSAVAARMMVAKLDPVVGIVADGLRPLPATLDIAKLRPR